MGRSKGSGYQDPGTGRLIEESSVTSINPWLVMGFAAFVFVGAVATLVLVAMDRGGERVDDASTSTSVVVTTQPTTSTTSTASVTTPTVSTPTTVVPSTTHLPPASTAPRPSTTVPDGYMNEEDALLELGRKADSDRSAVEELVGAWVPQVSAKKIGLDVENDDRGRYTAAMVLSDHLGYEQRYEPEGYDVLLVRTDEYNFELGGYLATVVAAPFANGEEANAWCNERGIGADDCFAKRLDHGPWKGSVLRRK